MNQNDLVPAGSLAVNNGVKTVIYSDPGIGKTPCVATAPRPVICAIEPGMLSMAGSNIPAYQAYTLARVREFFAWIKGSHEVKNFDTIVIDSGSQYADLALEWAEANNRDGRAVYGDVYDEVYPNLRHLFFMQQKHVVIICKKQLVEIPGRPPYARPAFPGKALNAQIPHMYDGIWHGEKIVVAGQVDPVSAFRTKGTPNILARDRSGRLAEFEPLNLAYLFNKVMGT